MSQIRTHIVTDAYKTWLLNMNAGMSPKVARETMEYNYEFFTEDEKIMLSGAMLAELEKRMEPKR